MNTIEFARLYNDIVLLSNEEGPRQNILEPKFTARKQMLALRESLEKSYAEQMSLTALSQFCRCTIFIGTNMVETEEEQEGVLELCKAYTITLSGAREELVADIAAVEAHSLDSILKNEGPYVEASHGFSFATEFLRVHNALGYYLSNRDSALRINDAKQVLHVAEKGYTEWDAWFKSQSGGCEMRELPLSTSGSLDYDLIPATKLQAYVMRYEMDTAFTSTLLFLAQIYTACQMTATASRYCHRTLYNQLLNKLEFSRKEWATNALRLSGFFAGYFDYGKALHCLRAGECIMPQENPTEETRGTVAWSFGRFYLHRLNHYADVRNGCAPRAPLPDELECWWNDFPLDIAPPEHLPAIVTFEDARACFKEANNWFTEALKYYVYDGCCTDHIELMRDRARLYEALIHFETDRERVISMHQRRAALLEQFPNELNFNAYPTLIRQLLFDLGAINEEIVELRIRQREEGRDGEKPLKDKGMNALISATQKFYQRFCDTWKDPKTGKVPRVLEEESRTPYFRALMRMAQLQLKLSFKLPMEEYKNISSSLEMFDKAVDFVSANPMEAGVDKEVALCREMVALLPVKQNDILRVYNRRT
uniref:KIF-binding protein n=1 Tax=Trypanosoma vivax (strain Y486) TaxID=1055687 RepID=G0TSP2_TRYVY|nr:conserved hypothetical protein [Trypanosoma vivax Y486]